MSEFRVDPPDTRPVDPNERATTALTAYLNGVQTLMRTTSEFANKPSSIVLYATGILLLIGAFLFKVDSVAGIRFGTLSDPEFGAVIGLAALLITLGAVVRFYSDRAQFQWQMEVARHASQIQTTALEHSQRIQATGMEHAADTEARLLEQNSKAAPPLTFESHAEGDSNAALLAQIQAVLTKRADPNP